MEATGRAESLVAKVTLFIVFFPLAVHHTSYADSNDAVKFVIIA